MANLSMARLTLANVYNPVAGVQAGGPPRPAKEISKEVSSGNSTPLWLKRLCVRVMHNAQGGLKGMMRVIYDATNCTNFLDFEYASEEIGLEALHLILPQGPWDLPLLLFRGDSQFT